MKKLSFIGVGVCLLCLLIGYKSQIDASKMIYSSQKRKPNWLTKPPSPDSQFLYFVGVKTGAETLEEGKESAIKNSIGEIVDYFGIKAKTRYEEEKNALSSKIMDQIIAKGEARISGVGIEEMYYEQWEESGYHIYDVFILLRYPRAEIEKEKMRLEAEKNRKRNEAEEIFNLAKGLKEKGEIASALENYSQALKSLKEIEGAETMYRKILNEATQMLGKIKLEVLPYDKKGKTTEGLKNSLAVKITYQNREQEITVKNIPVIFNFTEGKGLLERKVFSDAEGIAASRVKQINFSKQNNAVETFIEQDILPLAQAGRVRFIFNSYGEEIPLFEKIYSLSFGRGGEKEKIIFYKDDKPRAVLVMELFSPGATEKIVFQLNATEFTTDFETEKEYKKIEIEGMELVDTREDILFSTDESEKVKKWEKDLSSLKVVVEILDFKTKKYSNPYTGTFEGFERLKLKISIF